MKDDDWEELQQRAVSMIQLMLALNVKYNVLKETSPIVLLKKLQSLYMSKSLINCSYLKKELYQLKIEESTDVRDHLNVFNKLITKLASVSVKVDDEDKAFLLLTFPIIL